MSVTVYAVTLLSVSEISSKSVQWNFSKASFSLFVSTTGKNLHMNYHLVILLPDLWPMSAGLTRNFHLVVEQPRMCSCRVSNIKKTTLVSNKE